MALISRMIIIFDRSQRLMNRDLRAQTSIWLYELGGTILLGDIVHDLVQPVVAYLV
jgi:hypothetical protein